MPTIEKLSADKQIETFYVAYYGSAAGSAGFAKWEADYAKLLDHNTPKSALEMLGDYIGYSKETKALYPFLAHLPFNVHSALVR
jgi:hypothetical protein